MKYYITSKGRDLLEAKEPTEHGQALRTKGATYLEAQKAKKLRQKRQTSVGISRWRQERDEPK